MGSSKKSFIIVSVFIYILLSLPFLFGATLLDNHTLPIKLLIVMLLFPQAASYHNTTKSVSVYLSIFILYFFLICIFRSSYIINAVILAVDIAFFWECVKFLNNKEIYITIKRRFIQFSIIVAAFIVLSELAYKILPGIYSYQEIDDYKSYFNPIFGLINGEKERPCWFFAEPSYCGYYLGVCFFLLYGNANFTKMQKLLIIVLFAIAIFFTASLGTYVFIFLTLLSALFTHFLKKKFFLEIVLYASILFVLIIIPQIEELQLLQVYDNDTTSFLDRQERMNNANILMNNMSIGEVLLGYGINYSAEKYGIGLSDAYHKMYCEYGVIYLVLFLAIIRKTTVNHFTVYTFILLSFFSVIIHDSPIMLLSYYLIYKQSSPHGRKQYRAIHG